MLTSFTAVAVSLLLVLMGLDAEKRRGPRFVPRVLYILAGGLFGMALMGLV